MLIPFDMLAAILFLGYYTESTPRDVPALGVSLATLAVACLATAAVAWLVAAGTLRSLDRPGVPPLARRRAGGTADAALRVLTVVAYAAALEASAFPWSLTAALGLPPRGESAAVQIAGLLPFVLLFFAVWLPAYRLHRRTVPGIWTPGSYILHKARYNLYMLLAWIPFALVAEWLGEFLVLLPVVFLLAAWFFPLLLALAWGCKRLPEGEVMETVRRLEEKTGARFSRVYLWEPGGGNTQNAAAVGIVRPFRYLFLTPALIRNMSGPELEAVILHELGHVKNRHLLFYLFTSLAGINTAVILGLLLPGGGAERFLLTAALILLYFRIVFGWLSRTMERQADLFALEHSGAARGLVNALEKLGIAAGGSRLAASWHHLGIAERVEWLRQAERDPLLARRHNGHVRGIMLAGYLLSVLFLGGLAASATGDGTRPRAVPADSAAAAAAHWRRVMLLLPADPRPPLELAYLVGRDPARREEAGDLARRALALSDAGEVRDSAAKLLRELDGDGAERR